MPSNLIQAVALDEIHGVFGRSFCSGSPCKDSMFQDVPIPLRGVVHTVGDEGDQQLYIFAAWPRKD